MLRYFTLFLAGILLLTSCQDENKAKQPELTASEQYNQQGIAMISSARDTISIHKGLYLLDKAIATDSNNIAAYNNKIGTLLQLQQVEKALATIQLLNTKTAIPDYVLFEGMIYERHGRDTAKANQKYREAIALYDKEIAKQPNESQIHIGKGIAVMLKDGKEAGIAYYDSLKPQFEHDEFYKVNLKQYYEFDRVKFLEELW